LDLNSPKNSGNEPLNQSKPAQEILKITPSNNSKFAQETQPKNSQNQPFNQLSKSAQEILQNSPANNSPKQRKKLNSKIPNISNKLCE
jgi:hypothetical protein